MLLGLAILVAAGRMRRAFQQRLKRRVLMGLPEPEPERHATALITEGPHGLILHPRYVQILMALAGHSLFTHYLALYLL